MIIKILGLLDIITATLLIFGTYLPKLTLLSVAGYLLIKGLLFSFTGDFNSIVDILIGFYAVAITLGFSWIVFTVLAVLFLYQKGFMSLV